MKKMKFFAMAFAAIVAVAFSACKPQNEPNPDDGGDGDKTPTQVEVKFGGMTVQTYRGESMSDERDTYVALFSNETTKDIYSVAFASHPNDLKAPVTGTYKVVNKLEANDQANIVKYVGGDVNTKLQVESGTVVVAGDNKEMEITMSISLSDGENEKLHYKGAVEVVEDDYAGYSEPQTPVNIALKSDTAIYAFFPAEGDYSTQTTIQMVDKTNRLSVELYIFYASAENAQAQNQPEGTFNLNFTPGETEDFVQVGDYALWEYYAYQGINLPVAMIKQPTEDGQAYQAIYFAQTGSVILTKAENDKFNVTLKDWVSYNGSKFSAEFIANKFIEPIEPEEAPAMAPKKLAPKFEKQWNTSLFAPTNISTMKLIRK